jgi:guanylate kinase
MSGKVFVVSAPSGTGKNTLVNRLLEENLNIVESVSYTTRAPRPEEVNGKHYNFIFEKEFEQKIVDGDFLEYAKFAGNYYGTCRKHINSIVEAGKHVILVIETQGAMQLKDNVEATFIFVAPPSLEELERRLKKRNTESKADLCQRLDRARQEMEYAKYYDYTVINDDIEIAYQELRNIITRETL